MKTKTMTMTAVFTALTVIFSLITIPLPISPVPVSLSLIAVYMCAALLEKKVAALVQLIYIGLGIAGIPVFSNFGSGIGKIMGPTGGYIISYPIMAFFIAWILEKSNQKTLPVYIAALFVGMLINYTIGVGWLAYVNQMGLVKAMAAGALPFIAVDIIKVILSAYLAKTIRERLKIAAF